VTLLKKIIVITALLTLLCSSVASAKSAKDITSITGWVTKVKDSSYVITKSDYADGKSKDPLSLFLSTQTYGTGTSKLSLDSLSKNLVSEQDKTNAGFKSFLTKTDTSHYVLDIINIPYGTLLGTDYSEEIPFEQYLLSKNSNNTTNIVYRKIYIKTQYGMWSVKDLKTKTPIFNYDLIRQVGEQTLSTESVPSSLIKDVTDGLTIKGIEDKYDSYNLSENCYASEDGKCYPTPQLELYKKDSGKTIRVSVEGWTETTAEYKSDMDRLKKKKIKLVNHGSYTTYAENDPVYTQTSITKSKDGKEYLFNEVAICSDTDTGNPKLPTSILNKYKKDLDTLTAESVGIMRNHPFP
jgi:hypothetical protein